MAKREAWKGTLQEISGEKEDSFTKKESRLTWLAKILIALLLPLPFLMSLLDFDVLNSVFSENPSGVGRSILIATIVYAVMLFSVFPISFLLTRRWSLLAKEGSPWERSKEFWQSGPDILSLILTRNTEDSSSTTVRKPQPTTIEFRRILRRIIKSQKNSRLVFVVDNLDRIDPLEALGIWSVMVGLVADEAHRVTPDKEPLVIVPLDKVALAELVKAQHNAGFDSEQLIEKSFDVVFDVPPPVLSNWRSFYEQQFRYVEVARGNDFSKELYWAIKYFEIWCAARDGGRITPRKINRFLNQIVSLSEQLPDQHPPSLIAYYLANKSTADSDILKFLTTERPGGETGIEWQTPLAAIHYGVPIEVAAQVLLGDEVRRAIDANDREAFDRARGVQGFDGVLERYIDAAPQSAKGRVDANSLLKLSANLSTHPAHEIGGIHWDRIWAVLQDSDPENVEPTVVPDALKALIQNVSPHLISARPAALFEMVLAAIKKANDAEQIAPLIDSGEDLLTLINEGNEATTVTVDDIDLALKVLRHSKDSSVFAKSVRCGVTYSEVAEHLVEELSGSSSWAVPSRASLIGTNRAQSTFLGEKADFYSSLVAGVDQALKDEESSISTKASAIRLFAERKNADQQFADLASSLKSEGILDDLTAEALSNTRAGLLSAIVAFRVSYDFRFDDEQNIEDVLSFLGKADDAYNTLTYIRTMNDSSFLPVFKKLEESDSHLIRFFQPLLREAIRRGYIGHWLSLAWLLSRFGTIKAWLGDSQSRQLAALMAKPSDFETILGKTTDKVFDEFVEYLDKPLATSLMAKRLESYNADNWVKLLSVGSPFWHRISAAKKPLLVMQAKNSELHKGLTRLTNGSAGAPGYWGVARAAKVLPWLDEQTQQDVVRTAVRSAIERRDTDLLLLLSKNDGFRAEFTRRTVARDALTSLFDPLSRSAVGRTFIERHVDAMKGLDSAATSSINLRLDRALRSKGESVREWARFVSSKLR